MYWFIGSVYVFLDMTKRFRKYKVQPGTNDSIDIKRLISVITYSTEFENIKAIIQNLLCINSSHFNENDVVYRIFCNDFLNIQVILTVLSNQLLVAFPFTLIGFWLAKAMDNLPRVKTLPNFSTVIVDFIVFVIVEEIAFYYRHRWIHISNSGYIF